MFFKWADLSSNTHRICSSTVHIRGLTEPLTRTLQKYDITVCNKPLKTLQHEFPSPKHRPTIEEQTNVVYIRYHVETADAIISEKPEGVSRPCRKA